MITAIDYTRHTQIRDRIKSTINQLKSEGASTAELIEAMGNELQSFHVVDYRESKASTKSLTGSGADLLPDQTNDLGD